MNRHLPVGEHSIGHLDPSAEPENEVCGVLMCILREFSQPYETSYDMDCAPLSATVTFHVDAACSMQIGYTQKKCSRSVPNGYLELQ